MPQAVGGSAYGAEAMKQQRESAAADGSADPHEPRRSEEHEQLYEHLVRLCFSHAKIGHKNQLMLLLLVLTSTRTVLIYRLVLLSYPIGVRVRDRSHIQSNKNEPAFASRFFDLFSYNLIYTITITGVSSIKIVYLIR